MMQKKCKGLLTVKNLTLHIIPYTLLSYRNRNKTSSRKYFGKKKKRNTEVTIRFIQLPQIHILFSLGFYISFIVLNYLNHKRKKNHEQVIYISIKKIKPGSHEAVRQRFRAHLNLHEIRLLAERMNKTGMHMRRLLIHARY